MKLKGKLAKTVIVATLLWGTNAMAGNGNGLLTRVLMLAPSTAITGTATTPAQASCATEGEWAVDVSTAQGKSIYAMMLTAKSLDAPVTIVGTDTCDVIGDRETIYWIQINQ